MNRKRRSAAKIAFTIITIILLLSMVLSFVITTLPR